MNKFHDPNYSVKQCLDLRETTLSGKHYKCGAYITGVEIGGKVEAPKAPRGLGNRGRSMGRGPCPLSRKFLILLDRNGAFCGLVGAKFCFSLWLKQ